MPGAPSSRPSCWRRSTRSAGSCATRLLDKLAIMRHLIVCLALLASGLTHATSDALLEFHVGFERDSATLTEKATAQLDEARNKLKSFSGEPTNVIAVWGDADPSETQGQALVLARAHRVRQYLNLQSADGLEGHVWSCPGPSSGADEKNGCLTSVQRGYVVNVLVVYSPWKRSPTANGSTSLP
ncbi:MAG: hypothetical protein EOO27_41125 [Comamonadaceae bacterium]|nr:MAG: hypothetical protein EOO27_41125 [Comamonadaceae bacterium]